MIPHRSMKEPCPCWFNHSDEENEPTSKEGSAPNENENNGSNGHGSNGSDEGNGTSRWAVVWALVGTSHKGA